MNLAKVLWRLWSHTSLYFSIITIPDCTDYGNRLLAKTINARFDG